MSNIDVKLMFLASQKFESGKAVRGAFLMSDFETKPLEFRCTNPIRPTQLQSVLYGDVLNQYILVELIGGPLVRSVQDQPNIILVKDASFLDLRAKIKIPVAQIIKEEELKSLGDKDESSIQRLNSASGKFAPILIKTHSKFSGDKMLAKEILSEIFNGFNLFEPFNRVITALEQVHVQKIGEI